MNRDQVRTLVTETFTRAFDKTRFGNFAINLLNRIDESKAQAWNSQYIQDAFKDHVHRYERLGTYTSPDKEKLDVLIVYLTKESKLERARTAIRNFVAHHLKHGVSLVLLSKVLGHKRISTTERYLQYVKERGKDTTTLTDL